MIKLSRATLALFAVVVFADDSAAQLVRSGVGQNASDIQTAVDQFRADLGALQTGPSTGAGANNRREVNWDAVPDSFASGGANPFPGNFFNLASGNPAGRVRGIEFATSGTFEVSSSAASGVPVLFGNRSVNNPQQFAAFSPERIFGLVGATQLDVTFNLPGSPGVPAAVRGFGAVFTDVEVADGTKLEFFDAANTLLRTESAPAFAFVGGDSFKSFSFVGVSFASPVVSRVRITNGGYDLNYQQLTVNDAVAMDDFIYGEPVVVPEPGSLALAGIILVGAACSRRWAPRRA